jgi:proteasome accessory factor C
MVRKSTPLEKAARMLDLVPFISTHQGISTSELANQFGISEDELLSDLNSLWMCGDSRFDLIDLSFDSGYVTIRNAQTLNLIRSLSPQEIISIVIGLDLIEKGLPGNRKDLADEISSLRAKLGQGINRILDAKPVHDSKILEAIKVSLGKNQKIHISYFSPSDDEVTERDVTPLDFIHNQGHDFLIAYCDRAQGQRSFRVDRIQSAEILDVTGSRSLTLDDTTDATVSSVTILHSVRRSRESLGSAITGEGSHVSVSSYSRDWLSRTVISAAGAMKVTDPLETRRLIAERASKALQQYR